MKHVIKYIAHFSVIFSIIGFSSCQKFLDVKPSTDLVVPQTLDDFLRLMDNFAIMNSSPILGEVSADNYYLANRAAWQSLPLVHQRNAYLFNVDFEDGNNGFADWNYPYRQVFVANVVLEGLTNVERTFDNADEWDFVKGWALFMRSYAFFNLAQLFTKPYDAQTANSDLGIPLRLLPGVDENYQRATVIETYDRILTDMANASDLLSEGLNSSNRNRPSKEAAFGALARICLAMREYDLALEYANFCLKMYDDLLDFNDLVDLPTPFFLDRNHTECLWQSILGEVDMIFYRNSSPGTLIDPVLYEAYEENDLRKSFFFQPSSTYPGEANVNWSFGMGTISFGGIAVDEIYLIKSECLIRKNQIEEGLEVLNELLVKRYIHGTFSPINPSDRNEALTIVMEERRKELVFRGLRWQDIRRLNLEGANITISRNLDGESYQLTPNSNRFVLPIPHEEVRLNGLIQNDRN